MNVYTSRTKWIYPQLDFTVTFAMKKYHRSQLSCITACGLPRVACPPKVPAGKWVRRMALLAGVSFRGGYTSAHRETTSSLLTAEVAFTFLRVPNELFKQEFSHFIIDEFLLGYETVVMSIGDHYNFCMRKSVLKFGN